MTVNQFPTITTLQGGTLFLCYDTDNSDTRKVSASALAQFITSQLSVNMSGFITQYSAPNAVFTIPIIDKQQNVHLILTPTGTISNGAITLPPAANTQDGQLFLFNSTQAITTFNIKGNGATSVIGAPTSISANGYFTLKYDKINLNWYRIG